MPGIGSVVGGVMALGTASTETAIGGLAGVAATNSTLAWLDGGLGSAVLGGIVAGPALLTEEGVLTDEVNDLLDNNLAREEIIELENEMKTYSSNIVGES